MEGAINFRVFFKFIPAKGLINAVCFLANSTRVSLVK